MYGRCMFCLLSYWLWGAYHCLCKKYMRTREHGTKIKVELPLLGKLRTNYPALAFVFIGAGMALFAFNRTFEVKDQWVISGSFKTADSRAIDWTKGVLTLYPRQSNPILERDGSFHIELILPRSRKFEEEFGQISYFNWSGNVSATILVDEEYQKFKKGDASFLKTGAGRTRRYGPVEVRVIPKATN